MSEINDVYSWAVGKSRIDDPKDREMISKLEELLKQEKASVNVVKRMGRPPKHTWQEYVEAGVGKISPGKVAQKLGVTVQTVYAAIRENRSPTVHAESKAPTKDRSYYESFGMGKKSDIDVAKAMNLSRERVRQIRNSLGIDKPPRTMNEKWKEGLLDIETKLASGLNVAETARAVGMSANEVTYRIKKAGIQPVKKGPRPSFTKEEVIEAFKTTGSIHQASEKLGLKHYSHIFRYIDRYNIREMGLVKDGRLERAKS